MPDDFTHESIDLQWEPLTSDDQPGREWTYCRAKVFGGWLMRCERWFDFGEPAISISMTFVPDPNYAWAASGQPVFQHAGRQQESLPPPPLNQVFIGGLPPQMRVRFKSGAEAKVRYVPQNVKKVITCVNGVRTVEEIISDSGLDQEPAAQILRELINHGILELFEK
jgi:hypothetical protein